MASIAEQAEQDKMYDHDYDFPLSENCDVTEFWHVMQLKRPKDWV